MIKLFLVVIIIIAVAIFSVQNASPVTVSFLAWRFSASIAIILLLSALAGLITGVIAMSWFGIKRSRKEKKPTGEGPAEIR